jgi:NADH-quinone oxidoreductase subunit A
MPDSVIDSYFPLLIQAVLAMAVAAALVGMAVLVGKRLKNKVKEMPYECGITPVGSARERFSVKFYLVAMLFILFDIEAIFLYPWAVVFRELKMFAFVEMTIFIALVLCGLFFVWKKGVLNWSPEYEKAVAEAGKVRDAS